MVLGVIAALTLLVWSDFLLGRKAHRAKLHTDKFPVRKSNLHIFNQGPRLFEDLFSEIKRATQHVHILFYIVKNDEISGEFLSILKMKAGEGIEVRLLIDWIGSRISRKAVKQLKEAGVQFAYCNVPKLPFLFHSCQVRNHRKITVIDGKIGYFGGFNIGKEYIDQDCYLSPWRDYHLKVTGEGVQDLQKEFLQDWHEGAKIDLVDNRSYFPLLEEGKVRQQFVPSKGVFLEDILSTMIRKAETSITIGTPYFVPSRKIMEDLLAALKRGVSLTILTPFKSDHPLVKEASYYYLRPLLKHGATVYQYLNGFYHAKVMVIDDTLCDIGTANFDNRSFFINYELNCLIYDKLFIRKVMSILQKDFLDSRKMAISELTTFNPFRTLRETAARTISFFL
ncbi:cardiolipin synthase [Bacillus sp. T33-2]|nr:cardiolipin synthase [Bacillus sp. T33-2]